MPSFPFYIIFPSSVQTFEYSCCSLAFLSASILFWIMHSVTEILLFLLFLKTWCLSLYRVNFTIAHGFWPGTFRFPSLWPLSILIWDISMFYLLLMIYKNISSVSSVFVSVSPWISKQFLCEYCSWPSAFFSRFSTLFLKKKLRFGDYYLIHLFPFFLEAVGQRCSVKKVLENFKKLTGKHLCQILFFNKVAGIACNFIKKETLA